ncbi:histidine kinase [Actibacterium mucosum KCTC 23349]|uniref:Histidine kinase n=1 Tax=Actibacterium mucosum KCTC 23349 TaxID=1454373 RepID=A0A037ZI63_9RHOB|nr:CBS domain-containing protein [Actibacterium mucosum]KAJ54490.1 histidine kinase [Actibacterium mucosum KCTC 23349]
MKVQQILKDKPSEGIVSVAPTDSVKAAAELLSAHRIGCVVVSGDGQALDGILSERDIVRELGRVGESCLDQEVSTLMTAKVVGCAPGDTTDEILQKMTDGRFRHMPVLEDGQMLGLISIGDVVKARLSELSMEKDALQGMIMGH